MAPIERQQHIRRATLATFIAIVGCSIDLWTKQWMFNRLGPPPAEIWWIVQGFFGFETSVNTGALFGMGQGQTNILAMISVAAMLAIVVWLWCGSATQSLLLTIALGSMLAGVTGNLYDRLGYWGMPGVRDWILFRLGKFTWPNFNVADICLVVGAGVLLLHSYVVERAAAKAAPADGPQAR